MEPVTLAVAGVAAGAAAFVATQEAKASAAAAVQPPVVVPEVAALAAVRAEPEEAARLREQGGAGKVLEAGKNLAGALRDVGSSPAGTIAAGLQLQEFTGTVADVVGGAGAGAVARIAPVGVGAAVIAAKGTERLAEKLGAGNEVARTAGVAVAATLLTGPGALGILSLQATGRGLQELGRAVGAGAAVDTVSGAVKQFDPLLPGSAANKVVSAGASVVTGAAKLAKKLKFW